MRTTLIADLRKVLESTTGCHCPQPERQFHKDDEYLSFGLSTQDYRQIMREFRPRFLELPLQERLETATRLAAEHIGELAHAGIHMAALSVKELGPHHFSILDRLADDFRDWSEVDHFCLEVAQPLLWKHTEAMLALLKRWNRSGNRWKRRASVVAFTRRVGESGKFTKHVLQLCKTLMWDEEDTVQKGVGWALKDNLRSAPKQVMPFVKRLRQKGAPSTITLYAIRDLKGKARQEILAAKKAPTGKS
jgi:3-methyladenine DNA glycosylase AlkD